MSSLKILLISLNIIFLSTIYCNTENNKKKPENTVINNNSLPISENIKMDSFLIFNYLLINRVSTSSSISFNDEQEIGYLFRIIEASCEENYRYYIELLIQHGECDFNLVERKRVKYESSIKDVIFVNDSLAEISFFNDTSITLNLNDFMNVKSNIK